MYCTYAEIKAAGLLDEHEPTMAFVITVNVVAAVLYFLLA